MDANIGVNMEQSIDNKKNFIKEENRIYLKNDNDKVVAEINFEKQGDSYNIYHTFVDETLRGQGIASKLMKQVVNYLKSKNVKITASCSYANRWLEKNK